MQRRHFIGLAGGLFAVALCGASTSRGELPTLGVGLAGSLDYQKELEKGLKARRPTDFAFLATVVAKVQSGALPQSMVNETFDFARKQNRDYPFIYFQFVLRKRADKLGVKI
jgi:hypothetical protein